MPRIEDQRSRAAPGQLLHPVERRIPLDAGGSQARVYPRRQCCVREEDQGREERSVPGSLCRDAGKGYATTGARAAAQCSRVVMGTLATATGLRYGSGGDGSSLLCRLSGIRRVLRSWWRSVRFGARGDQIGVWQNARCGGWKHEGRAKRPGLLCYNVGSRVPVKSVSGSGSGRGAIRTG
jgi:hypothetical protein